MTSDHLHQLEPSISLPTFHLPRRLLLQTTGAATPDPNSLDSDVVLILAALLCALICVVGLAMAARCAWLRRAVVAAATPAAITTNKGLKKKAIRALPKLEFSPAHRATLPFSDCPICLADFAEGDEVRILPRCAHVFHVPCIDTWLTSHSSCPSCRQNLAAKPSAKQVGTEPTAEAAAAAADGAEGAGAVVVAVAVTGPPSPGVGRCRWCGAGGSAVADADDGREHGGKGRDDGHDNQYLP